MKTTRKILNKKVHYHGDFTYDSFILIFLVLEKMIDYCFELLIKSFRIPHCSKNELNRCITEQTETE